MGQTLVGAVAEAVGARPAGSQELLGHFVRAGGGDVGKAASLYLGVREEFLELRQLARCVFFFVCWVLFGGWWRWWERGVGEGGGGRGRWWLVFVGRWMVLPHLFIFLEGGGLMVLAVVVAGLAVVGARLVVAVELVVVMAVVGWWW